jgi:hypothetical protein
MKFTYTGSRAVRVVWGLILIGAVTAMLTTLALSMTPQEYPGLDVPRSTIEQVALGAGIVAVALLVGTPFFTAHEVGERHLEIKQGILFRAEILYDEIESVDYGVRRPLGLGVRWYPGMLFVITWPANLVEIRLGRPRVFRILRVIPLPAVRTIVVNVDEPFKLLVALRERVERSAEL